MRNAQWLGRPAVFWLTVVAAALMVIGGMGPWARVLGIVSVSGTNGDGWFLIIGGVLAGALLARQVTKGGTWPSAVLLLIGLACAVVAFVDLNDIAGVADEKTFGSIVDPGWGIYASLVASVALAVAAALTLLWRPYASGAADPAPVVGEA
jgi:hypothetical protein